MPDPAPLFTAEELATLGAFATPAVPAGTAPEPGAAVAVKPDETPPPDPAAAAAAAKPPAAEEPDEPEDTRLEDLQRQQGEVMASIERLSNKLLAEERAKDDRREEAEMAEEFADNPALQKMHTELRELRKETRELKAEAATAREDRAVQALASQKATVWEKQANDLMKRFPGMVEKDLDQVWDWMEKNPAEANGMSVSYVAESVLGYEFLDARRSPVARPPGGKHPSPPEVPAAKVVTDAALGSGALPRAPSPPSRGGDVRDVFNEIRGDPAALGQLGKWG